MTTEELDALEAHWAEEHCPWSYTEAGVLCICGSAMTDEVCNEAGPVLALIAKARATAGYQEALETLCALYLRQRNGCIEEAKQ